MFERLVCGGLSWFQDVSCKRFILWQKKILPAICTEFTLALGRWSWFGTSTHAMGTISSLRDGIDLTVSCTAITHEEEFENPAHLNQMSRCASVHLSLSFFSSSKI